MVGEKSSNPGMSGPPWLMSTLKEQEKDKTIRTRNYGPDCYRLYCSLGQKVVW